ncbi:MAG TPA: HEAT repeat domain-containing protein [Gemmataceae bacterium]|jgi:tetratricopeptide (TPR) repeat protein|nr:HEAT repeat domain-containing protein [Gemmataceae bacterium]
MGTALLVEYFDEIPEPPSHDLSGWEGRVRAALEKFRHKAAGRYNEGTLQRLLHSDDAQARRASVLALGMIGTMKQSNAALADMLHDEDPGVKQFATEALWSLWFRGDTRVHCQELRRLVELRERRKKRAGLDALIAAAPNFAEAHNQRAILHFQNEEWHKAAVDCERTLKLNPYHFGAAAGLARCHMELGKHRAALKAFRHALRINPALDDVEKAIRALETALGEEGKRDDKK